MTTHELHIDKTLADEIVKGRLNFIVISNWDKFQTGDNIKVTEVFTRNNCEKVEEHFIYKLTFQITYVWSGFGIEKDYVALSIKQI